MRLPARRPRRNTPARVAAKATAQQLLERAAFCRVLGRLLAYPGPGHLAALQSGLRALPVGGALRPYRAWLARCRRLLRTQDDARLAADYLGRFVTGTPVLLRETAYGDGRRMGGREVELADLNGFYRAFGFALSENDPDLPDHLAVELEFLSLLMMKEAYAILHGLKPQARITADAVAGFLETHLGRWIGALHQEPAFVDRHLPWAVFLDGIDRFVMDECRSRHVRPQPFSGRLPADAMQDETFTCPQAMAMS